MCLFSKIGYKNTKKFAHIKNKRVILHAFFVKGTLYRENSSPSVLVFIYEIRKKYNIQSYDKSRINKRDCNQHRL